MRWIGIDPGATGGVAILDSSGHTVLGTDRLNEKGMAETLKAWALGPETFVVIEKAQAMPKQGVVSMFTYGQNYGTWLGILNALELRYTTVRPQEWKAVVLKGTAKDKAAALEHCRTVYGVEFKKTQHGQADALCMAEYARRVYNVWDDGVR